MFAVGNAPGDWESHLSNVIINNDNMPRKGLFEKKRGEKMRRELSADQIMAINARRNGQTQATAYKLYLLPESERDTIKQCTLNARIHTFFARPEVKALLAMGDDEFEKKFKRLTGETRREKRREKYIRDANDKLQSLSIAKAIVEKTNEVAREHAALDRAIAEQEEMSADKAYFDSLQMAKGRPDEIILTGTARYILKRAIQEIDNRAKIVDQRIENEELDPLDKDATAFTASNIKAVQLGVSILENRTERAMQSAENSNTLALELLNRSICSSGVDVESYTAPIPATALAAQTKQDEAKAAQ